MFNSIYRSPSTRRSLSAREQGTIRAAASILAQHDISFEEATLALDRDLRHPEQPFQSQAAASDTPSNLVRYSAQNALEALLQNMQGPSVSRHVSLAGSGGSDFIIDEPESMVNQQMDHFERETFEMQSNFAEGWNFPIPDPFTSVTDSLAEYYGFAQVGPEPLSYGSYQMEIERRQSQWSDEGPRPVSNPWPPGNYLSGQNAMTYMTSDHSVMDLDILDSGNVQQSHPIVLGQYAQPYVICATSEMPIEPLIPEPDESALPGRNAPKAQTAQPTQSHQASKGKKRKQDEIADDSDVTSLSLQRRKRRQPANVTQKEQTAQVRQIGSCVRCAIQHNKCRTNPRDPEGICITCHNLSTPMSRLPCLRLKLSDSILFRKFVDPTSRRPELSVQFDNGILKPIREWNAMETRVIELTQNFNSILRFRVRAFDPRSLNFADITEPQRFVYECPWALADFQEAVDAVGKFIERSIKLAVHSKLSKNDKLAQAMFLKAFEMAHGKEGPEPSILLHNVLKLWTASRCIEGGWRFNGSETLGLRADNKGIIRLTDAAIIDSQQSSIIVHKYLKPLRQLVLDRVHTLTCNSKSRRTHWLELLLANFILLHNCECVMKQQRNWARENSSPYRYTLPMMELVKGVLCTSKIILAYFHYALKGQFPFSLDWNPTKAPNIAELSSSQHDFVKAIAKEVQKKMAKFAKLHKTTEYETDNWFTGQLFLPSWEPPHTIEEAPLAS